MLLGAPRDKIRLTNHQGDELQVEEHADELTVVVRYFARQPSGELVKLMEVRCLYPAPW